MATIKVKLRPSRVVGKAGVIYYQITHNRKQGRLLQSCVCKHLSDMTTVEAMEFLQKQMNLTRDNDEFLATMNQ